MKQTMGQRVRRRREEMGLTQTEVAAETGVDRSQISKVEKDNRSVSVESLAAIATVLNLSLDYLYFGTAPAAAPPLQADGGLPQDVAEHFLIRCWRALRGDEKHALALLLQRLALVEEGRSGDGGDILETGPADVPVQPARRRRRAS